MKKLLIVSAVAALGLSSLAFAGGLPEPMPAPEAVSTSDTGLYAGLNGGYGMTNWKNKFEASKDNGVLGRAFLGFDLNRYFAVEAGYSYFFNKPKQNDAKFVKRTHAIDLMAKIKAPVVDNFDLYAKIGANYLMTSMEAGKGDSIKNFNVAFGAGADYYVTSNVIVNVEWLRFNGKAKVTDSKYQPSTDAFLLGLRYRFDI